jgi:hypothetical protein
MRVTLLTSFAALVMLAAAVPASGHHAFAAEFDANKPIKLRGTVAKMEWINPHTWIHIDVKRPNGTIERWAIEGGPPNALFRRGFSRDSLPTGIEIVVEGFQAKDGSRKGNGRDLTFAGFSGLPAPARPETAATPPSRGADAHAQGPSRPAQLTGPAKAGHYVRLCTSLFQLASTPYGRRCAPRPGPLRPPAPS